MNTIANKSIHKRRSKSILDRVKSFTFSIFGYRVSLEHESEIGSNERTRSIALIAPSNHDSIKHIHKNFVESLVEKCGLPLTFDQYLLRPHEHISNDIATIVQKKYDLIFTIGALCSKLAVQQTTNFPTPTPVLFSGVQNPEKHGLIGPDVPSHVTGLKSLCGSYAPHVSLLLSIKPHTRNIMIAYNSTEDWIENDVEQFAQLLAPHKVKVLKLRVEDAEMLKERVKANIAAVDTLVVLRDNLVASEIESLGEICTAHGVTLFASDLYSVEKGAAIGLGSLEDTTGRESAERARLILEQNVTPCRIPVAIPHHTYQVHVNRELMLGQGLVFPSSLLSQFNMVGHEE